VRPDPVRPVRSLFTREFLALIRNARQRALAELRPRLKERELDVNELVQIIELLNTAYIDQPGRTLINQYVLSAYKKGIDNTYTDLIGKVLGQSAIEIALNFTRYDQRAIDNLAAVSLSDLHGFTAELSKKIVRDIVEIDKKGGGITKFSESIQNHYNGIGAARAETIARTVSTQAHNEAAYSRIQEYAPFKEWIPTITDHRTRASHLAMKGVIVPVDEAFKVPGFHPSKGTWVEACLMKYPGDSSLGASASQVINCRCAIGPRFRR
jgi:hypothetical protein